MIEEKWMNGTWLNCADFIVINTSSAVSYGLQSMDARAKNKIIAKNPRNPIQKSPTANTKTYLDTKTYGIKALQKMTSTVSKPESAE